MQSARFTEKDIKRIYKRFKALDTNQNGELDPHELFDVPEIADVSYSPSLVCLSRSNWPLGPSVCLRC